MTDTAPPDLDALAASFETTNRGSGCTVCSFIASQPDPAAWDALMEGPRQTQAIWRLMKKQFGYAFSDSPVTNHRTGGHRR